MKKGIASISLFVYILVSCGVIVNFHYCMNRLDSLQLFASNAEVCGKCGMHVDDSMGCCRDEVKIIKMEEDQKVHQESVYDLPLLSPLVQVPSAYLNSLFVNVSETRHHENHSPPLLDEGGTYLENCVFRI
jgi:hypothetical protein